MDFQNSFEVPLPPSQAWTVLLDVRRMVLCMPGAELVEIVDDKTFKGKMTVRLGPVTMNFAGTVNFAEMDAAAFRAVANARGSDAKGRGAASAVVQFELAPSAGGSLVTIKTALSLTGAVAQYGRASGVIKELANQLTADFAQRLRAQVEAERVATPPSPQAPPLVQAALSPSTSAPSPSTPPPAAAATSPPPPVEALSAGQLIWKVLVAYVRRLFGRQP